MQAEKVKSFLRFLILPFNCFFKHCLRHLFCFFTLASTPKRMIPVWTCLPSEGNVEGWEPKCWGENSKVSPHCQLCGLSKWCKVFFGALFAETLPDIWYLDDIKSTSCKDTKVWKSTQDLGNHEFHSCVHIWLKGSSLSCLSCLFIIYLKLTEFLGYC